MAKVKLGAIVGDIRGKVGGSAFVKSRGGLILRNVPSPVNKNTVSQSRSKNITASLQWEWQQLTPAQRSNWELWTKLNPIAQVRDPGLRINAQQTFIKLNFYRTLYNVAIITDPIFDTVDTIPLVGDVNLVAGDLFLDLDRPLNDTTELFILFLTFRVSPTINNPGTGFRSLIFNQVPGMDQYMITSEYQALFGIRLVSFDEVFMKFTTADKISGKLLPFQQIKVTL